VGRRTGEPGDDALFFDALPFAGRCMTFCKSKRCFSLVLVVFASNAYVHKTHVSNFLDQPVGTQAKQLNASCTD
jgi:hypothetical protein